jgi:transcriptional regulator GlxA family with amidase domain
MLADMEVMQTVGLRSPARSSTRRSPPSAAVIAATNRVLGVIGGHAKTPTLGELAAMASMSRSHFSHTFHVVVGMPLREYVRNVRLKHALALVLNSTLSLTTIAVDAGYYDLPHFDKTFRRQIGLSPQEYRTRHGRAASAGRTGAPRANDIVTGRRALQRTRAGGPVLGTNTDAVR